MGAAPSQIAHAEIPRLQKSCSDGRPSLFAVAPFFFDVIIFCYGRAVYGGGGGAETTHENETIANTIQQ